MEPQVLTEFLNQYNKLANLSKEKNDEQSKIDLELSDFYHRLEGTRLSHVCESHKMIKELKDILTRRRLVKYESLVLRAAYDRLKDIMPKINEQVKNTNIKHLQVLEEIKGNANKKSAVFKLETA